MSIFDEEIEEEVVQYKRKKAKPKEGEPKKGGRGTAFLKDFAKWKSMNEAFLQRNSSLIAPKELKRMKEQSEIATQSWRIRENELAGVPESLYRLLDRLFNNGAITRQLRHILKETGDPIKDAQIAKDRAFIRSCGAKV